MTSAPSEAATPPPFPTPSAIAAPEPERPRPRSPAHLFWVCTGIALQGFGGVVAVVQRELVDRHRWLTPAEFTEDWAVAQTLPGANVVNLSMMVGSRHFGLRGAVAAVAGMLLIPALLLIALAVLYGSVSDAPAVQGALRGVGAVAAGLILATGLKMAPTLRHSPLGLGIVTMVAVAAFVAVAWLRVPLAWVLGTLGLASCVLAHVCLGRQTSPAHATPAMAETAGTAETTSTGPNPSPAAPPPADAAAPAGDDRADPTTHTPPR